ncbi:hypothetical protein JL721_6459 [Aureococcus anophagefferens]|nr:hypothetical protein JL721_6459 [Aureococcus anophagefferens]
MLTRSTTAPDAEFVEPRRRSTAMAAPREAQLDGEAFDEEVPKLPLYIAFGLIFGVAPMLPHSYNKDLVWLVSTIYKRVGPGGLLAIPFCTLTMEKVAYDTYTAYWGKSIYEDAAAAAKKPVPQFPSGGSQLPSFSVIETRKFSSDHVVFRSAYIEAARACLSSSLFPEARRLARRETSWRWKWASSRAWTAVRPGRPVGSGNGRPRRA